VDAVLACRDLKNAGYRLSLGAWAGKNDREQLEALADFLRIEPKNLSANEVTNLVLQHKDAKTALIAQVVDSPGKSINWRGGRNSAIFRSKSF
jgi:hypothetical protein